jgi:hypothetical protein
VTTINVNLLGGVGHRHKTVAKIVVFGRFYSKNRGKSAYTVTRKIEP